MNEPILPSGHPLEGRLDSNNIYPVLVVDDTEFSRSLIESTLAQEGYTVVTAENGREALSMMDHTYFPIVITDWLMPDLNGIELCRAIRQRQYPGYVFTVIITALDSKEDMVAGLEAGADEYLTKPFHPAELIARLNTGKRILDLERSLVTAYEKIRFLSITDPLTDTYNRTYINSRLPEEIARSLRYRRPLSVVMCDIDDFKQVNDVYGHQSGDAVLEHFATCLRQTIRPQIDWVARYGGEEFLIILPETGLEGAEKMAERARQAIAAQVTRYGDHDLSISASFGVASADPAPDKNLTANNLIRHADLLMYQAKGLGKNRVVVGDVTDSIPSPEGAFSKP